MILDNSISGANEYEESIVNHHSAQESRQRPKNVVWVGTLVFLLMAVNTAFAGFLQLDGVADVKTRFSRGCSTMQEVAELARARRIDTVIFGDQARDALSSGNPTHCRIENGGRENRWSFLEEWTQSEIS